ncbi:PcfK-like family protein [Erysipelotrichaceae bacterium OttesenSCG-928-M19]|nr:PcfK-like family protein [Erysipelotrichaceae bacterium OttesenSCG-928-M19]
MSWKQDNSNKPIMEYLELNHKEELDAAMQDSNKSINDLMSYIFGKASQIAQKSNVAMVDDETVYSWAVHYIVEPKEVIDSENVEKINAQKVTMSKTKDKSKTKKDKSIESENAIDDNQLSIFNILDEESN